MSQITSLKGKEWWASPQKREIDRTLGKILLVPTGPFIVGATLAVFAADRHWPFVDVGQSFGDRYVGKIKIRSMIPNAEKAEYEVGEGAPISDKNSKNFRDPRITKVGKYFRFGLDEMPQLWNVAKGEMSLVGPRVVSKTEMENWVYPYQEKEPYLSYVDSLNQGIRPGMVSLAMTFARYLPLEKKLWIDKEYADEVASLENDFRIMFLAFARQLFPL